MPAQHMPEFMQHHEGTAHVRQRARSECTDRIAADFPVQTLIKVRGIDDEWNLKARHRRT